MRTHLVIFFADRDDVAVLKTHLISDKIAQPDGLALLASHKICNPFPPTLSLAKGTNRQFYCTGMISYNKTRQLFFVFVDRKTLLGLK